MRILIGCDTQSSADGLYHDLKRSGLPESVDVYILSVADVFMLPGYKTKSRRSPDEDYLKHIDQAIRKAQKIADALTKKLVLKFPGWRFHSEAVGGSVSSEILKKAQEWKVDLIVVGSHGRIGVGEFFIGSVALKVLSEAPCSVRIVRTGSTEDDSPGRFVIGVDGSAQSDKAIDLLTGRCWKLGTAVHLVTVTDTFIYTAFLSRYSAETRIGTTPDGSSIKKEWRAKGNKTPTAWIERMHEEYKSRLQRAGLIVSSLIKQGDAKKVLVEEARRWGADGVFVGAWGHSRMDRFFIGSVSSAVAARAHCSVEIIRNQKSKDLRNAT